MTATNYQKTTWVDATSQQAADGTLVNADRLNNIEDGITDLDVALTTVASTASGAASAASAAATAAASRQPGDPDLTAIAGLDSTIPGVLASDGAGWISKSWASVKTALALVKADLGLGNVDNTADANKPVSTAQQAALNLRAPIASPTFTGTVSGVSKAMVGLGNVDNTADVDKPVSTATATALSSKADLVAGVIPTAQIPALALTTAVGVADQAAMLALTSTQVQPGDIAVRADGAGSFVLVATPPSTLANWVRINAPTDAVTSVNGQQGTVVLSKSDVGLANVNNTSDASKPVSTATQAALDAAKTAADGAYGSVRTSVKTAAYTAAPGDLVPVDTTGGPVTITLPTAPVAGSRVTVKHIIQASTNAVTVACGGSDVLNKTGGSTSVTLAYVNQGAVFVYSGGIWTVTSTDLPKSALDTLYAPLSGGAVSSALTINSQTGSYTFVLADAGSGGNSVLVELTNAAAITATVPPDSSVAWPVGSVLLVSQGGAGQVTLTPGAGVTFRTPNGAKTSTQWAQVALTKRAANDWIVSGDTTT